MDAEFRYLDGVSAGQVRVIRKEFATLGRHSSADLRFDLARDLDVSVRHAAVFRQGDGWVVRDLGSTNGTWINASRLRGDHVLTAGDVIRLGSEGPQLQFRPSLDEAPTVPVTEVETVVARPRVERVVQAPGTTERIRVEVRRQTAGWKRAVIALVLLAAVVAAGLGGLAMQRNRELATLRSELLGRTDSLLGRLSSATSSVTVLSDALDQARRETAELRARVAARGTGAEALDSLERRLAGSLIARTAVLEASRFDPGRIDSTSTDGVAVVVSALPGGNWVTGTGFAIAARGDTGWIVTAAHLVADSLGPARRLGVVFNGSGQHFRAQLLRVADSADLAVLTVRIRGGVPVVHGLAPGIRTGAPVAMVGFPLGLDALGRWKREGVRAVGITGTVRRVGERVMEIDGYGVSGSSGSPLMTAAGGVAGMVFGGDPSQGGRLVYALPAERIADFLRSLGVILPP